jgi:uncharacterized repeat protein (TIGR03803 family)
MKTFFCVALIVLSCGFAVGQQYKVLWNFGSPNDGAQPLSNLILDRDGNLYGTTRWGGSSVFDCSFYCGTVFKLSPNGDGTWSETILYTFCSDVINVCVDGAEPMAGLIFDAKGNLYGTTSAGGTQCLINSCGVVFELSPPSSPGASWTETVLHSFCPNSTQSCPDGAEPLSGLTMDLSGNLYGTTSIGGSGHDRKNGAGGTVFELSHGASGWTETVLYNFCTLGQGEVCPDGTLPQAGVTFDKLGNLYGTTVGGGNYYGFGTLYELSPGANGWTETVLRTSRQSLAAWPLGTVSFDPLGNLYSTFSAGGQSPGVGGVFRLGPHGGGTEFSFDGNNGDKPAAGVLIDAKHSALYGTTSGGDSIGLNGTVFKMVAPEQLTVLYNFCSQPNCSDGAVPLASLIEDKSGNLYGTAKYGGTGTNCPGGCGVVFEIVQSSPEQKASQRPAVWHTILPSKD